MIIVEPVILDNVGFDRPSNATYWDRNGVMRVAVPNQLRATYDPTDLAKAPYALVEQASINMVGGSDALAGAGWGFNGGNLQDGAAAAPTSLGGASRWILSGIGQGRYYSVSGLVPGSAYSLSVFCRYVSGSGRLILGAENVANGYFYPDTGEVFTSDGTTLSVSVDKGANGWNRFKLVFVATASNLALVFYSYDASTLSIDAFGLQFEPINRVTSYISSPPGRQTERPADNIGHGPGLLFSNVPINEPVFDSGITYPKGALVYDPIAHNVFESITDANLGKALTDVSAWTPRGATNSWAMLDQYNNTQTTSSDEILVVVAPQVIAQGLYLGNLLADELRVSVVDPVEGVVYSEVVDLQIPMSGSSYFKWCFKRIQRKDYYGTTGLPPYARGLVTINLRKLGSVAKCGMCAVGPIDDFGPTLYGLSTEGKDYSSTTFNFDGTSTTTVRPYAKRMTCDVIVNNQQIDYVQRRLFDLRQRLIIWFGGPYGSTVVAGRYESFKNTIQYPTESQMNLTIGGAV